MEGVSYPLEHNELAKVRQRTGPKSDQVLSSIVVARRTRPLDTPRLPTKLRWHLARAFAASGQERSREDAELAVKWWAMSLVEDGSAPVAQKRFRVRSRWHATDLNEVAHRFCRRF